MVLVTPERHMFQSRQKWSHRDHLKFSFLMLFARKTGQSQPQETVLIAVKLVHTQKVKLLEALFGYKEHILILTPQFSEVLHPLPV